MTPAAEAIRRVAERRFHHHVRTDEYWEALAAAALNAQHPSPDADAACMTCCEWPDA